MKSRGVAGYVLAAALAGYLVGAPAAQSVQATASSSSRVLLSGTTSETLKANGVLTGVLIEEVADTGGRVTVKEASKRVIWNGAVFGSQGAANYPTHLFDNLGRVSFQGPLTVTADGGEQYVLYGFTT